MNRFCSILILNYNGRNLLEKYLPSVIDAVKFDGGDHEIVVIDNASSDGSIELIKNKFPQVKTKLMEKNNYLFSYNTVIKESKNDYVILLNTDVKVEKDFIQPLLKHFSDPQVFSVVGRVFSNKPEENFLYRCPGEFRFGMLETGRRKKVEGRGYTLLGPGGAAVYDRSKFISLGGFDSIYYPGYGEDDDLSYRAWARGWKIIFEPKSKVFHYGGVTYNKMFTDKSKRRHKEKVSLILVLKNISDRKMLAKFSFFWLLRIIKGFLTLDVVRLLAYFDVLAMLPQILSKRKKVFLSRKITDKKILEILNENSFQKYEVCDHYLSR